MKDVQTLLSLVSGRLAEKARANAVVGKPISVGERHVVPLCELSVGLGGLGGGGQSTGEEAKGSGVGGGAGGGAKATPVAVLVIEDGKPRVESFGL